MINELVQRFKIHLEEDGNWRSAENLKVGDRIITANGKIESVDSVEEKHYNKARRIYNLIHSEI